MVGRVAAMKLDLMTGGLPLRRMQELARDAQAAGFDGLVVTEGGRTAYLPLRGGGARAELDILTGMAVAFPRSPMITAAAAWELAEASGGRFRLGLGTQVRAHIERRYGGRLRSARAAPEGVRRGGPRRFAAFRGAPLAFDGEYWKLSLLPAMWSPGAIDVPDPPIDVAAVNPWMLRMAGEVADGVHVHPLNTPTYLSETVLPNVAAGAAKAGATRADVLVIVPTFAAPGRRPTRCTGCGRWRACRWRSTAPRRTTRSSSSRSAATAPPSGSASGRRRATSPAWPRASTTTCSSTSASAATGPRSPTACRALRRGGRPGGVVLRGVAWARDPATLGPWGELGRSLQG